MQIAKTSLYAIDEGGNVVLKGNRCSCGNIAFPARLSGCERCGRHGDDLLPATLSAKGVLVSSAIVYRSANGNYPAPYAVCRVTLESGIVVRGLMADLSASGARPGSAVSGALMPQAVLDGACDLRFVVEKYAGPANG